MYADGRDSPTKINYYPMIPPESDGNQSLVSRKIASTSTGLDSVRIPSSVRGPRLRTARKPTSGFTLVEILVVLALVAVLAAVVAPVVTGFVDDANLQRAREDSGTLADGLVNVHRDLGDFPIFRSGGLSERTLDDASTYDILFGPGRIPGLDGSLSSPKWEPISDGTLGSSESGDDAGELSDQLVGNAPGYPTDGRFAWKGPYVEDLVADPWGNAYLVNAENLRPAQDEAAYVISAGPNETIETAFEISRTSGDVVAGGDDVLRRVR